VRYVFNATVVESVIISQSKMRYFVKIVFRPKVELTVSLPYFRRRK